MREIDNTKISYIMTKPILDMYLSELHGRIATIYGTSLSTLKNDTLLDFIIIIFRQLMIFMNVIKNC